MVKSNSNITFRTSNLHIRFSTKIYYIQYKNILDYILKYFSLYTKIFQIALTNFLHLKILDVSHNLLLGTLPQKMFPSSYNKTIIDLSRNLICGEISYKLGPFLQMNLSNNNHTGIIPPSICNVFYVNISYNYFKGPIPLCVSDLCTITGNKDVCIDNFLYKQIQFQPCLPPKKSIKVTPHAIFVLHVLVILILAILLIMCYSYQK